MKDAELLNIDFTQTGNICAITSYGIISEYCSKKKIRLDEVISNFVNFFPDLKADIDEKIPLGTSKAQLLDREQMIYNTFVKYCENDKDKRGFALLKELHENDTLGTSSYCQIKGFHANKDTAIERGEIIKLKEKLKLSGLAMVLFPVEGGSHSIVIGYDEKTNRYFKRDPMKKGIEYEDFLEKSDVYEYIYFNETEL